MTTPGDTPSGAQAPADAGVPAEDAHQSAVDLSDLDKEQEAAAAAEGDEDEEKAKSTDQGDDDGDSASDEDDDDADDDSEGDEGDEDEDADDEGDKPKKRNRSQRYRDRISKLEEELSRVRGRNSGDLSEEQISAKVKEIIGEPPKESDYPNDYLAFDRALTAYELDKRQAVREVKAQAATDKTTQQARMQERADRHVERVQEFRERGATPDEKKANAKAFDEAMAAAKAANAKVAPHVEELIIDSDKSGHLTLYFAKNPGKLDAINRMSERDAARQIGRIEARLSVPKPKTQSSAPPPPKRPGAGATTPSPDGELDAYLNKQYGNNRR